MTYEDAQKEIVEAALAALSGGIIDGRKFWTEADRQLMAKAIEAAIETSGLRQKLSKALDDLFYTDLRASGGIQDAP